MHYALALRPRPENSGLGFGLKIPGLGFEALLTSLVVSLSIA